MYFVHFSMRSKRDLMMVRSWVSRFSEGVGAEGSLGKIFVWGLSWGLGPSIGLVS